MIYNAYVPHTYKLFTILLRKRQTAQFHVLRSKRSQVRYRSSRIVIEQCQIHDLILLDLFCHNVNQHMHESVARAFYDARCKWRQSYSSVSARDIIRAVRVIVLREFSFRATEQFLLFQSVARGLGLLSKKLCNLVSYHLRDFNYCKSLIDYILSFNDRFDAKFRLVIVVWKILRH